MALRNLYRNWSGAAFSIFGMPLTVVVLMGVQFQHSVDKLLETKDRLYRIVTGTKNYEESNYFIQDAFPLPGTLCIDSPQLEQATSDFGRSFSENTEVNHKEPQTKIHQQPDVYFVEGSLFNLFDFEFFSRDSEGVEGVGS